MNDSETTLDYLVVGSGLAALSFSALMSQKGYRVKIFEAHEFFGGYGHTFTAGDYSFNAHLHYVVGCGEQGIVTTLLKKLDLDKKIHFIKLNSEGYDRIYCENKILKIPYSLDNFQKNLLTLEPDAKNNIEKFISILGDFSKISAAFPRHLKHSYQLIPVLPSLCRLFKYRNATLEDVFQACHLSLSLQTLIAGQLLDYLAPPKALSFIAWAALFVGYTENGAYYPEKHFTYVIDALVKSIQEAQGELVANTQVTQFILENNTMIGVETQAVDPKTGIPWGPKTKVYAKNIIGNIDPKRAAHMIGWEHFSPTLQKKLDYDYSGSSFIIYAVVKDINLREYGFGSWNIWHCPLDHNKTWARIINDQDYSDPYFAMNSCSLHTADKSNCPKENHQILQILCAADYDYWVSLKIRDRLTYNQKKLAIFNQIIDIIEAKYIPHLREHIAFKMIGSPTTNERYVLAPQGGAYGVNLTPRNFQWDRKLGSDTSIKNFYFCSAAAGVGGFAGALMTGVTLYEKLTHDYI